MTFTGLASGQPANEPTIEICLELDDAQGLVYRLKDYEIVKKENDLLREKDKVQEQRIANLEKEVDLLKQEVSLQQRIISIKDMEIAAQGRAIQDLHDITDRAIKLAEVSKPTGLKEIFTPLAIIVGAILIAIGL